MPGNSQRKGAIRKRGGELGKGQHCAADKAFENRKAEWHGNLPMFVHTGRDVCTCDP